LVEAVGIQPVTASLFGALVGAIVSYVLNRNITFQSTARHSKTAPKFFFTAFLAVVLNTVFMAFFTLTLRLPYPIAQVLTTGLLLIVTFGLNKFWSFKN
jgi:putative flippase GtrA